MVFTYIAFFLVLLTSQSALHHKIWFSSSFFPLVRIVIGLDSVIHQHPNDWAVPFSASWQVTAALMYASSSNLALCRLACPQFGMTGVSMCLCMIWLPSDCTVYMLLLLLPCFPGCGSTVSILL